MSIPKYHQLVGTVCGGLVMILPTISSMAMAQPMAEPTTSKVNPCPGIFYEEPYNYRVLVPVGCPPNALTLRLMQLGIIPFIIIPLPGQNRFGVGGEAPSSLNPNPSIFNEPPYNRSQPQNNFQPAPPTRSSITPLQPPAPAQRQEPSTKIALVDGKANVRLINNTNAKITYQVIGDTAPRILEGKSDVTLRGLSTPITVTFEREDGGLLMVKPQVGRDRGNLDVTLKETTDVNQDRSAMSIQSNGLVFLN